MPEYAFMERNQQLLVDAVINMLKMYQQLVDSGDCGYWDFNKVKEVIEAKAALKANGIEYE